MWTFSKVRHPYDWVCCIGRVRPGVRCLSHSLTTSYEQKLLFVQTRPISAVCKPWYRQFILFGLIEEKLNPCCIGHSLLERHYFPYTTAMFVPCDSKLFVKPKNCRARTWLNTYAIFPTKRRYLGVNVSSSGFMFRFFFPRCRFFLGSGLNAVSFFNGTEESAENFTRFCGFSLIVGMSMN